MADDDDGSPLAASPGGGLLHMSGYATSDEDEALSSGEGGPAVVARTAGPLSFKAYIEEWESRRTLVV